MSIYKSKAALCCLFVIVILLSGCAVKDNRMYHWGSYENVIYAHHLKADETPPQLQIETLTMEIDKASANGKPVAPGIYAHLGMLYASIGDLSSAIDALEREKQAFPESAVLIDGLLNRVKSNNVQTSH
ncbi:DUF4810 domain-containing protein [Catenovulum sediminis]|uniref:DUF4810 domain-containing protein n=1 Tax=Catenovulum sediminis TaxID=1740262 RepID=A0ABV1RK53_9ALTE|nr:DUF4810 domain-containing protein [Catenovulum sediminis]